MPARLLLTARLALIGVLTASILGPAIVLANLHPVPVAAMHRAAATIVKIAARPAHAPWYALEVAEGHPGFHAARVSPTGAPAIAAAAGILVDIDSGEILWSQHPHLSLPPASTTKELSAMVALENFSPDQLVTVTPDALNQQWDESKMGLKPGERLTVQELLEGMLLVSGNDAAQVIATDTVGQDRFVAAMNAQVRALGLRDSHFATPVGLSDPTQFASPYDLAVIAAVAYDRYPLFRTIVSTVDTDLPASAWHQDYQLHNLNQLLQKYPAAVGIKPGFTYDAGPCLVGMAVRHGHRLVAVLMHAAYPAAEEARLLDWGFATEGLPTLLPSPSPTPAASPTPKARVHG